MILLGQDGEEATEELELFGAVGEDELGAGKVEDDEEVIEELKHFVSLNDDFKQCERSGIEEVEGTGVDEDGPEDERGENADEEEEDEEDSAGGRHDRAEERAVGIFHRMDVNNDGRVTRAEFVRTCLNDQKLLELLTPNTE